MLLNTNKSFLLTIFHHMSKVLEHFHISLFLCNISERVIHLECNVSEFMQTIYNANTDTLVPRNHHFERSDHVVLEN